MKNSTTTRTTANNGNSNVDTDVNTISIAGSHSDKSPWIPFLLPKNTILPHPSRLYAIYLPHPRTNHASVFLAQSSDQASVLSLFALEYMQLTTSCFYQDLVVSNGSTLVAIPIDPLFILLPIIESHASKHYISLESILHSKEYKDLATLALHPQLEEKLDALCDHQSLGDESVFRFSKQKCTQWLTTKWNTLGQYLHTKATPSAIASPIPIDIHKRVFEYMSEWVSSEWIEVLLGHLRLDLSEPKTDTLLHLLHQNISSHKKPYSSPSIAPEVKKQKKNPPSKAPTISKKQSTLSSFFKKS